MEERQVRLRRLTSLSKALTAGPARKRRAFRIDGTVVWDQAFNPEETPQGGLNRCR
ncbi:protein of unknown function [Magnetospirillum gryphiswaldense MSR-1 v2]|uniref:Uncharacterized protein n=1 Tax=Magnetospirillum gryphiswaldense (strain DSM 6361 / JCM 21280 / NBRC 15271 / MSR-1) TaxID=431944 RepID=V6EYC4_MAGGM|nr:protein of unknown function [Magnetospirillum gryphiswaldense MSR-1 v2]